MLTTTRGTCIVSPMELHAHVSTTAVDCDGPLHRDYTVGFNDDEVAAREAAQGINDFSDIDFMQRVMMSVASPYAVHQMTVKVDDSGIDVHEHTEEGYRAAWVVWCHDECDLDYHSQRDVFAEQMGY